MPIWALIYTSIIFFSAAFSIVKYRSRGVVFLIGEGMSAVFSIMIFLYYYELYPKPSSYMIVLGMILYVIYWEFVEVVKIAEEDMLKDSLSLAEVKVVKVLVIAFFTPFLYISSLLLEKYF